MFNNKEIKNLQHVAIIMDGNGRWAKQQGEARLFGHNFGVEAVRETLKGAQEIGVKYLTMYAFSTENWKRPKSEINFLFSLLENFLKSRIEEIHKQDIRLKIIGNKNICISGRYTCLLEDNLLYLLSLASMRKLFVSLSYNLVHQMLFYLLSVLRAYAKY